LLKLFLSLLQRTTTIVGPLYTLERKRQKSGLNTVINNYDGDSQIVVTNNEAEGTHDGMIKKGTSSSFFNAREEYITFLERPSVLTFEINDYFVEDGDNESERTGHTTVNQSEL